MDLDPSELGTREYWDNVYDKELLNHKESGDIGEVWFGEQSVRRISNWLKTLSLSKETSILDVGCGNGNVLIELADKGYINLTGVDYSEEAIKLAKVVKESREVKYEVADILDKSSSESLKKTYGIIIDKGTYDAISLTPEHAVQHRQIYIENIHSLLQSNGYFCITSCNWTSEELKKQFIDSRLFQLHSEIPVKQFSFGGQTGQTVCCLIFCHK